MHARKESARNCAGGSRERERRNYFDLECQEVGDRGVVKGAGARYPRHFDDNDQGRMTLHAAIRVVGLSTPNHSATGRRFYDLVPAGSSFLKKSFFQTKQIL